MTRRITTVILLVILSVTVLSPDSTAALSAERSVEGNCEIVRDGTPLQIEFNAQTAHGITTGEVTFRDVPPTTGPSQEDESAKAFYLKARVDCLVVKDDKALLLSTVIEANAERYIGGQLILVAMTNGDDNESLSTGRITWGFYRKINRDWIAVDSDRSPDEVTPGAWLASDSERIDDQGKVTTSANDDAISCSSFPLSGYTFKDEYYAKGTVRLRP